MGINNRNTFENSSITLPQQLPVFEGVLLRHEKKEEAQRDFEGWESNQLKRVLTSRAT